MRSRDAQCNTKGYAQVFKLTKMVCFTTHLKKKSREICDELPLQKKICPVGYTGYITGSPHNLSGFIVAVLDLPFASPIAIYRSLCI